MKRSPLNMFSRDTCNRALLVFRVITVLFAVAWLTACAPDQASETADQSTPEDALWTFSGPIMGTQYRVSLVVPIADYSDTDTRQALDRAISERLNTLNKVMSHYVAESDLNQLNQAPANESIVVDPQLADVLALSKAISELSGGAFDVTLSPVIDAWGFGANGVVTQQPNAEQMESLRARIGHTRYSVETPASQASTSPASVIKHAAGVTFNLSAIAKGYAVDDLVAFLIARGYNRVLVDIGGELRSHGANVGGKRWRVGVEKPVLSGGVHEVIELTDSAIATSGDYRNFIEIEGERFSHTIDPVTLKPALHKLASISVLDQSAARADALATAILALGEEQGLEFASTNKIPFYAMIRESGDAFRVVVSEDFAALLATKPSQSLEAAHDEH